jgi:hypothetical protein
MKPNGPCASGFPKVDVRATDIEGLSFAPIWHLFVIYASTEEDKVVKEAMEQS